MHSTADMLTDSFLPLHLPDSFFCGRSSSLKYELKATFCYSYNLTSYQLTIKLIKFIIFLEQDDEEKTFFFLYIFPLTAC
jgi:hypothetical protein